jgi:hypothetical protein
MIIGDKTIFPAIPAETIANARMTMGRPTRGLRMRRSRLTFNNKFDRAKKAMTIRNEMVNNPERMVIFVPARPNMARPIMTKIMMDQCGALVNFSRRRKNRGRTWSQDNRSIAPHDEIVPVSTAKSQIHFFHNRSYLRIVQGQRQKPPHNATTLNGSPPGLVPIECCLLWIECQSTEQRPRQMTSSRSIVKKLGARGCARPWEKPQDELPRHNLALTRTLGSIT